MSTTLRHPDDYEWRKQHRRSTSENLTCFRKHPKVRGKAAVKAHKRERQRKAGLR
jgi:hypothetical protein